MRSIRRTSDEVYFACDGCEAMWALPRPRPNSITARSSRGNILFVSDNPLIAPWAGPYGGVPPWDRMAPEHFPGAFAAAIAEQRSEIDAIAANTEAPTFDNTIAAMERAGRMLDRLERMFGVARESVTNPAYQALEREWQPKLAASADELLFNEGLFKRIEAVYEALPAIASRARPGTARHAHVRALRAPWRAS